MKNPTMGYIVTSEYFNEPLELCEGEDYPWPVLIRGDVVTVFETLKAAKAAIKKTIEWARRREEEEPELKPLEWADESKHRVWRLCGAEK